MSMWLQTRRVRHLVPRAQPVGALCGAAPRMWFNDPPGTGQFVFDNPHTNAPANLHLPICSKCANIVARLTRDEQ